MQKYNVSTILATPVRMKWSAGRTAVEMQAHLEDQMFPPPSSLNNVQSFLFRVGFAGSDAEALSTAAHPLDVGVVEYKLVGQLCLHKVHLGPEKGQLSFFLDEHRHT